MSMDITDIPERLQSLNDALSDKFYTKPNCDFTVEGDGQATIWVRTDRVGEFSGIHQYVDGYDLEGVFDKADELVDSLEDFSDTRKKDAVRKFGRSIDGLREAGIDAEFVDPLSDTLKALSENLLTHQPGTGQ